MLILLFPIEALNSEAIDFVRGFKRLFRAANVALQ